MKGVLLKLYLSSIILFLFSLTVQAQDFRFIYIQTENQKPFYIKMGNQSISSAASGYIILPRLTGGSYKVSVGLPQSTFPEFSFTVDLKETDAGYLIKNDADQGFYLADLKTMEPVTIERQFSPFKSREIVKCKDAFARILSEVVSDSSICEKKVLANPATSIVNSESLNTKDSSTVVKPQPIVNNMPATIIENKAHILKLGQKNTAKGLLVIYLDNGDTVEVFIPVNRVEDRLVQQEKKDTSVISQKENASGKDVRFIDMELQNPNQLPDSGAVKKGDFIITQKKNTVVNNMDLTQEYSLARLKTDTTLQHSACKIPATQHDYLELRKILAAGETEMEMQSLALKQFKSACFTTGQIKNLGALFITEEARYKFFVSAYPYVFDASNYATLENQLTNSYFINRFKAMLNH